MEKELLRQRALAQVELDRRKCIPSTLDPDEVARCCVHFINTFCYTFDPKRPPYHFPFILFDFQRDLVHELCRAIILGYDIFVDKCREMGATYTTLDVLTYFWNFLPGSNFLLGSRKEDYVDNTKAGSEITNKEESLFGKIEYTLNRLYPQVMPKGYEAKKHLSYMSLINPELGNVISGESANDNFSRGGRQKAILLDEFAFWDSDSSAWGSTADTSNCRIVLTTPGLKPSKAKRLRFGLDEEEVKVVTLPYSLDPRKDQAWLDAQRKRRSKEDFAREIMIDWEGSLKGIVYPEIAYAAKGDFPYDPRWPLWCSWDFGLDTTAIGFFQVNPNTKKLRMVDYYENAEKVISFYFPFFGKELDPDLVDLYTVDDIRAIREISKYKAPIHFGDPDVAKRSYVRSSTTRELQNVGINVLTNRVSNDFLSRREQTKLVLQEGIEINENGRTGQFVMAMENARFPQRPDNSQAVTEIKLPIHDWTSHGRTMFEYFCVNFRLGSGRTPDGGVLKPGDPADAFPRAFRTDPDGVTHPDDLLEQTRASLPERPY